jgi:hypothetical protein
MSLRKLDGCGSAVRVATRPGYGRLHLKADDSSSACGQNEGQRGQGDESLHCDLPFNRPAECKPTPAEGCQNEKLFHGNVSIREMRGVWLVARGGR